MRRRAAPFINDLIPLPSNFGQEEQGLSIDFDSKLLVYAAVYCENSSGQNLQLLVAEISWVKNRILILTSVFG